MCVDPARAKTLFLNASDLTDPAERAAYLDRECGGDAELRGRVEALLKAHGEPDSDRDQSGSHFDATLISGPAQPESDAAGDHCPEPVDWQASKPPQLLPTTDYVPKVEPGLVIAGRYTLLQKIGEGGMGEVWVARQTEPVKRKVALKLIKTGMDSKAVVQRFEQERQALALMDHPNIARVLDGGLTPTGQPFFVMELVNGLPVNKFCDELKLSPRQRLELFVPICQAVQHAHQKGIVHRDLKPANILVTMIDSRPLPKVIDFGVAKATAGKLTEETMSTGFGAVVGTLEYMSPEQAGFSGEDIDTRADIYSLGVILYELLTGLRPIDAKRLKKAALTEMIRIIQEEEPSKPSTRLSTDESLPSLAAMRQTEPKKLMALLRGELDWVVMKCLEKQRDRRYDTANALSRDIQRYLADEVVEARPPSAGYRLKKFVRRHKGQVLAASLVLFALLAGMAGTTWGLIEAKKQEQLARQGTAEKEKARLDEAERVKERDKALGKADEAIKKEAERVKERDYQLGISDFLLAVAAYDNRDAKLAAERLGKVPLGQRGWEWAHLRQQVRGGLFTLYGHTRPVVSVSFSSDGARIVTGSHDGTAKVWDARTGTPLLELKGDTGGVNSVSFSPDGTRIVTGGWELNKPGEVSPGKVLPGKVKVWDARTGTPLLDLKGHTSSVRSVSFSPDGARIVTGSNDGTAKVWDARTGTPLLDLKGQKSWVYSVSFSPDGTRIVTGCYEKTATVWDARTGTPLLDLKGLTRPVESVSFSPDGTRIVTGSDDGIAKVCDARTGTPLLELKGHTGGVVSFSPDGGRIATSSFDRTAKVWDARTGTPLLELKGHSGDVNSVGFSPDGTRIVTGSGDGTAKVWDARTGTPLLDLKGHTKSVSGASFSPDGTRIVTGSFDKTAKVWDARTGTPLLDLKGHTNVVNSVGFSPDGTRIVTGSHDKTAKVWDARTGTPLLELKGHTGGVYRVGFSPDGTRIATGSDDGTAKVWDARTGTPLLELKGDKVPVASVSFSPDGGRIVTGWDVTAKVWDARTGTPLLELKGHTNSVSSASFSPDGTRIVTGSYDKTARVWDARTGTPLLDLKGHTREVTSVGFSPDGTRIVTGGGEMTAKVWDARTGTPLLDLKGHTREVASVSFSPDGARIATGSYDNARVWDTRTGQELKGDQPLVAEERDYRLFHTRPNDRLYAEGYDAARQANDPFAARFYLDRILSLPEHRTTARFSERNALPADPLVIARTGFHHPALAKTPYDRGAVALLAVRGDRLALRLVAQQLLRDGKPGLAIPLLFACLLSRPAASPPVEELLLAQACLDLKQPDEARRFFKGATEWLDRPRDPRDNLGVGFAPNGDPRRNPFNWEEWYECDAFRAEVEKSLAKKL